MDPLGIADIYRERPIYPRPDDYWTWCRRHQRAVKADAKCKASAGSKPSYKRDTFWDEADRMVGTTWELEYDIETCKRIGPFMSEREANRLGGCATCREYDNASPPLGMEVES